MLPSPFTPEQQKYITENYKTIGPKLIAKELGVKDYKVYNFGAARGIGTKMMPKKKVVIVDVYFNVDELENWVA